LRTVIISGKNRIFADEHLHSRKCSCALQARYSAIVFQLIFISLIYKEIR
jgi:hypothetical protein